MYLHEPEPVNQASQSLVAPYFRMISWTLAGVQRRLMTNRRLSKTFFSFSSLVFRLVFSFRFLDNGVSMSRSVYAVYDHNAAAGKERSRSPRV